MTRAEECNLILVRIFRPGHPMPDRRTLLDAYPYGQRKYWPYKVWCRQVRAWKMAHAQGLQGGSEE